MLKDKKILRESLKKGSTKKKLEESLKKGFLKVLSENEDRSSFHAGMRAARKWYYKNGRMPQAEMGYLIKKNGVPFAKGWMAELDALAAETGMNDPEPDDDLSRDAYSNYDDDETKPLEFQESKEIDEMCGSKKKVKKTK